MKVLFLSDDDFELIKDSLKENYSRFDISDRQIPLLEDSFASVYHYSALIEEEPNPESKWSFFLRQLEQFVKEVCRSKAIRLGIETSKKQSLIKVNIELQEIERVQ